MMWAKKAQNNSTYDITHKKYLKPKTKKNFFSLQTWRVAKSFEGLNNSLVQSAVEIFPCKNTCKLLDFSLNPPEAKVLTMNQPVLATAIALYIS